MYKNSFDRGVSHFGSGGASHFGLRGLRFWSGGSPILVQGVSHLGPGGLPFWSRGSPILVRGSPILVRGVSHFGLEWSPGSQPRGKLRGICSRPTAKREIERDLVQAHSQGGSSGDQKQTPPPKIRSMSGRYASYWNAFLSSLFKSSLRKKVRTPHVLR